MKNKYEARLGTERMLPLVFKMALPAVAAQFVNLLYNIVCVNFIMSFSETCSFMVPLSFFCRSIRLLTMRSRRWALRSISFTL